MNYEDIKKLIDDMGNSKLTEISIDFPDGTKIGMKKEVKVVEKLQEKNIQHIEQKEVNIQNNFNDINIREARNLFYNLERTSGREYVEQNYLNHDTSSN